MVYMKSVLSSIFLSSTFISIYTYSLKKLLIAWQNLGKISSDEAENLLDKYLTVLQHERQHKMHMGFSTEQPPSSVAVSPQSSPLVLCMCCCLWGWALNIDNLKIKSFPFKIKSEKRLCWKILLRQLSPTINAALPCSPPCPQVPQPHTFWTLPGIMIPRLLW